MTSEWAGDDDVEAALAELRLEFRATLPGRVGELVGAARAACASPADGQAWSEAHMKAHRLHGTSGSYGFLEVGDAAGRVEAALEGARDEKSAAAWSKVEAEVQALLAASAEMEAAGTPSAQPPAIPGMPSGPPVNARVSPRVLVVFDDEDFLRHVEALSKKQLFVVRTARSASEALALAAAEPIDAALVDVHLDAEKSFDLARRLRSLSPAISLAFVSADESVASRVAAAHAGASLFLTKPLGAFELTTALRILLLQRPTARPVVLVVDDDPALAALATTLLGPHGIDTAVESDASKVLAALDRARPDLALVDVHMPGVNGVDVVRTIRVTQRWQALPVVVLTQDASIETRMAAFEAGADDYLLKPVLPQELLSRVRVRLERARLLHEMTHVDPLTRLLSRRAFLDALAPRLSDSLRHERPLAIALLDVDHFKSVNDRFGHAAGDRVLSGLGALLGSRFRLEDLRCRWGGEEFVVAFPGEDGATIDSVLQRVLEEIRTLEFTGGDGTPFRVTFSAGVATLPRDGSSAEALLKVADERLYAAKAAGRARVISRWPL